MSNQWAPKKTTFEAGEAERMANPKNVAALYAQIAEHEAEAQRIAQSDSVYAATRAARWLEENVQPIKDLLAKHGK